MFRYVLTFSFAVLGLAALSGNAQAATQTAIFAGGCFWCVQSDFDHVPGVISTTSGYIGGSNDHPTYENHTSAGHREAVKIEFDDSKTSYAKLLDAFWHSVDPLDTGGQFCDRGHSYTTAIYAVNKDQLTEAEKSKAEIAAELKKPIATEIVMAPTFWPAEEYHQEYYKKNPIRYRYYRYACGRDARVESVWGKAAHEGIAAH
jgi:peptide-methionine (S)-S-oxide reductase